MRARTLIISFVVLLVAGASFVCTQPVRAADDEQAIRAASAAFTDAFNKGNPDGVVAVWASDGEYVNDEGKSTKGRDQIAALFKEQLGNLKGYTMKTKGQTVRLVKPDVALEDGTSELVGPDGTSESSRYVALWIKNDGKWVLARVEDLPGDEPATGNDTAYKQLKQLEWLIGTWTAEDKDKEASVTLTCKWAMNKSFLAQDYTINVKGEEMISVSTMIGWDVALGQIRSWFFDSQGGFGDGPWTREGRKWTSASVGEAGDGSAGSSSNSLEYVDDNTFIWRSQDRQLDGRVLPDREVKFTRKAT